jgi:hypothetical protein
MVDIAKINGIAVANIAKYNGIAAASIGKVMGATWSHGPTTIGEAYGGGYYAGQISVAGNGVASHYLIVSPKATGETSLPWGLTGVTTGIVSVIDGPANSAALAALGASYEAATFCEGLSIGGETDWYLPSKNELEVLFYFLKPVTNSNDTSSGSNANAVSPEPISTNYSAGSPAQTSSGINFRTGESEAFTGGGTYLSSTEGSADKAHSQTFDDGWQSSTYASKADAYYVRAVRRVAV